MFTSWSSGNRFASVYVKRMYFHCVLNKMVMTIMPNRIPILLRKILRAIKSQKLFEKSFNILLQKIMQRYVKPMYLLGNQG